LLGRRALRLTAATWFTGEASQISRMISAMRSAITKWPAPHDGRLGDCEPAGSLEPYRVARGERRQCRKERANTVARDDAQESRAREGGVSLPL
jgi:hypothetical protein